MGSREADWHEKYDGYLYVPALRAPSQTLREAKLADALEEAINEWEQQLGVVGEHFATSLEVDHEKIARLRALLETK